jgi:hypothetical protein
MLPSPDAALGDGFFAARKTPPPPTASRNRMIPIKIGNQWIRHLAAKLYPVAEFQRTPTHEA